MPKEFDGFKDVVINYIDKGKLPREHKGGLFTRNKPGIIAGLLIEYAKQSGTCATQIMVFLKLQWHEYKLKDKQNKAIQASVARLKLIKEALIKKNTSWQQAFHPYRATVWLDNTFVLLHFNPSVEHSILPIKEERFLEALYPNVQSYVLQGSTFCTNSETLLQRNMLENQQFASHVLDAVYALQTQNEDGTCNGYIIGLADGCGGHFGDERQDKAIAKTARIIVKYAVQLMTAYPSPETLSPEIPTVVSKLDELVKALQKTSSYKEGSTLVCYRAFMGAALKNSHSHVVGFNIGDSMLIGYRPISKTWINVSPAKTFISQINGTEATAIFPSSYRSEDIVPFEVTFDEDVVLMSLSDGVYENLPCVERVEGNAKQIALDLDQLGDINQHEEQNHSTVFICKKLIDRSLQRLEEKRELEMEAVATTHLPALQAQGERIKSKIACLQQDEKELANNKPDKTHETEFKAWLAKKKAIQTKIKQKDQRYASLEAQCHIQIGDDFSLIGVGLFSQQNLTNDSLSVAMATDEKITKLKQYKN